MLAKLPEETSQQPSISYATILWWETSPCSPTRPIRKEKLEHKGEPAVFFSKEEVVDLSSNLNLALVGKFVTTRPSMEYLKRGFKTIGFKAEVSLGLMDHKHILIRFSVQEDFHRCWLKETWNFWNHHMKVLNWTPSFRLQDEPSLVPVWISLDRLPIYLYRQDAMFSIGSLLGTPIKLDVATKIYPGHLSQESASKLTFLSQCLSEYGLEMVKMASSNRFIMKMSLSIVQIVAV